MVLCCAVWCGVMLCGVVLCCVVLCGVMLCGVVLCGVVLCGAVYSHKHTAALGFLSQLHNTLHSTMQSQYSWNGVSQRCLRSIKSFSGHYFTIFEDQSLTTTKFTHLYKEHVSCTYGNHMCNVCVYTTI